MADIEGDIRKAKLLQQQGVADTYVLLTNMKVSQLMSVRIKDRLQLEANIESVLIFGSEWISQKILEDDRLRMLVPRIYGLGDLSQILDERAYKQARKLLLSLQDDLRRFVRTHAYERAVKALEEFGFVCLIGEPACGKTTIAHTLALAAADRWHCRALRLQTASEFSRHWNTDDPRQFVWVDDAFGATQYQSYLASGWMQAFPMVKAAIDGGMRVVFTSRDYIYERARKDLKKSVFPLLMESQVVIDVRDLTASEREDILYNHVKLGDQTEAFRRRIKPWLSEAAQEPLFIPETARRLGTRAFTSALGEEPSRRSVLRFVKERDQFIRDTLLNLGDDDTAALALLFTAGGELQSPLRFSKPQTDLLDRLGSSKKGVVTALKAMEGSFVKLEDAEDDRRWVFRHPTLRDAFSRYVRDDEEMLPIYLDAARDEDIFAEVTCGRVKDVVGAHVVVPRVLFPTMAGRLDRFLAVHSPWTPDRQAYSFLANRCSEQFLKYFFGTREHLLLKIIEFCSYLSSSSEIDVLVTLNRMGLLSAKIKDKVLEQIGDLAVETPDADWLDNTWAESIGTLLTDAERASVLERVEKELIPNLYDTISNWESDCPEEYAEDEEGYFAPLVEAFEAYSKAFHLCERPDLARRFDRAVEEVRERSSDKPSRPTLERRSLSEAAPSPSVATPDVRDRFDDVDC